MDANALLKDVLDLTSRYGVENVKATLIYIEKINSTSNVRTLVVKGNYYGALTDKQYQEVFSLSKSEKINAIKKLREYTGLGLKEAKDVVESW